MKEIILFDDALQTVVPDDFEDMSLEAIGVMFPHEQRPQIIKGSPDGSTYVTFSLVERTLSRQQLFVASHSSLDFLKKFYPSCHNQRVHVIPLEDSMCGWFSFTAREMINILFIISIENKMILGTCGCSEDDTKRLEDVKMAFLSVKTMA